VVSLWQIDDVATSQLMDRYYGALRSGVGRSEALRHAQLDLLCDGRHSHPFYWAAFLSIGNEKPLEG
jgi:CHAT domain-containing protein